MSIMSVSELSRSTRQAKERESEDLRRAEYETQREAHRVQEKMHKIEELNRELRKVNLHSFVRETGSKVGIFRFPSDSSFTCTVFRA